MLPVRLFTNCCAGVFAVAVLSAPAGVWAAWSSDPTVNNPVALGPSGEVNFQSVPDGFGGAFVVWEDYRDTHDIYAQHVDANGNNQWGPGGMPICTATSVQQYPQVTPDAAGGAIIAWEDYRNGGITDIYAQRVNTTGQIQWTTDGVAICAATGFQYKPQLAADGNGGAIVTWHDQRSMGNNQVFAQRVNGGGVVQWTADGVPCTNVNADQLNPRIVADGSGGAVIGWYQYYDPYYIIYGQRLNPNGTRQWGVSGNAITSSPVQQAYQMRMISDGAHGAVTAWTDSRSTNTDIYAQRMNGGGIVQWTGNGVPICTETHIQVSPELAPDGTGGAFLTWFDYRVNVAQSHSFAQRINGSGIIQWTADGIPVTNAAGNQNGQIITTDNADGAIIAWSDHRTTPSTDIYAQRFNSSGTPLWTPNGVAISTNSANQSQPRIVPDGAGGAIVVWSDGRTPVLIPQGENSYQLLGSETIDLYASHVNKSGNLGPITGFTKILDEDTTLSSGWSQFGTTTADQSTNYDGLYTSLRATIGASPNGYRIIGWLSNAANTMYYSSVGSGNFVRAKYYLYATDQAGTAVNQIPNFRVRVANRFAFSAILQVKNHLNSDPEATNIAQDIRPSTAPLSPSIYRVDLDPCDVPQLTSNPGTEGFLRLFEAYESDPQANGTIAMTECVLGTYPALGDFTSTVPVTQNGLIKAYRTNAIGGGDFGNGNSGSSNSQITIAKYFQGAAETTGPQPSVSINTLGVTLETLSVQSDRYGAAALDVFNDAGDQANHTSRARVEPGKQYKIRFHATSTKQSNTQSVMRFRARTIKFQYTSALEVGGSQAASVANNTLAAQVLPGVGNQIPLFDRVNPTENGGWYNVIMVTPMNPGIQASQPRLAAQDGPGVDTSPANNSKSRRDLQFGIDVIDTFSTQAGAGLEAGHMVVDRVDIEKYDLVAD